MLTAAIGRWFGMLLAAIIFAGCATVHGAPQKKRAPAQYGEAGPGKIRVSVSGSYRHTGIFWLPQNARLADLVELAKLDISKKGELGSDPLVLVIRVTDGKAQKFRFWGSSLKNPETNAPAAAFRLRDGDLVTTTILIF